MAPSVELRVISVGASSGLLGLCGSACSDRLTAVDGPGVADDGGGYVSAVFAYLGEVGNLRTSARSTSMTARPLTLGWDALSVHLSSGSPTPAAIRVS